MDSSEGAAARRTRERIIIHAITKLSTQPEASMTQLARAAEVSRSTLHRHFADRAALVAAIEDLATARYRTVVARARLAEGTGLAAFERLVTEMFDELEILSWWFRQDYEADGSSAEPTPEDLLINETITRGQADGSIDPAVDPRWLATVVWTVLYSVRHVGDWMPISPLAVQRQGMRSLLKAAANEGAAT